MVILRELGSAECMSDLAVKDTHLPSQENLEFQDNLLPCCVADASVDDPTLSIFLPPVGFKSFECWTSMEAEASTTGRPDYFRFHETVRRQQSDILTEEAFSRFSRGLVLSWDGLHEKEYILEPCQEGDRLCSQGDWGRGDHFFMYTPYFKELDLKLPFCHTAMRVLEHTKLAPSQIAQNSWVFLQCFDWLCQHLGMVPTANHFFRYYSMSKDHKGNFVVLGSRQGRQLFSLHTSHGKKFKSSFVRVRANAGLPRPFWRNNRDELVFPLRWNARPIVAKEPDLGSFEGEDRKLIYALIRVKTLLGDQTLDSRSLMGTNYAQRRRYFSVIMFCIWLFRFPSFFLLYPMLT